MRDMVNYTFWVSLLAVWMYGPAIQAPLPPLFLSVCWTDGRTDGGGTENRWALVGE